MSLQSNLTPLLVTRHSIASYEKLGWSLAGQRDVAMVLAFTIATLLRSGDHRAADLAFEQLRDILEKQPARRRARWLRVLSNE